MKLIRNNKYKGYMLSMITVMALMSGCGKNEYSPVISEPVQTIEATVETEPIVETTVATEPIVEETEPEIDLSKSVVDYTEDELKEKISELGVIEDEEVYNSIDFNTTIFQKGNGVFAKSIVLFTTYEEIEDGYIVRDAFTNEDLFILNADSYMVDTFIKPAKISCEYINENFSNYKLVYNYPVIAILNIKDIIK